MNRSDDETNLASATFERRWLEEWTFIWLISGEILEGRKEVLAKLDVHRPLMGKS